jgi:hypothetical protein
VLPSAPLTRDQLRSLDAELLRRLAAAVVPISLADLFRGYSPAWALDAAERLEIAGQVSERDGEYGLTAAGRARLAAGERK